MTAVAANLDTYTTQLASHPEYAPNEKQKYKLQVYKPYIQIWLH